MMKTVWSMFVVLVVALALPPRPAAAQEPLAPLAAPPPLDPGEPAVEGEEAIQGLGPFEFAPSPLAGNVGAPRSAVPETRLGVALHWVRAGDSEGDHSWDANFMSLLIEGHLALFGSVEVGVDMELLQYLGMSAETPDGDHSESEKGFGFITPRVKVAFFSTDMLTLAGGLGIALPTPSHERWDHAMPLAFDPGVYVSLRLLGMLSINASLPFVVSAVIPDEGDTEFDTFFTPTIGVAVRPFEYITGFLDLQFLIWLDPDDPPEGRDGPDSLQLVNLIIGARSQFLPFMMGELGMIIPVGGDLAEDDEGLDFGLGLRLVATPDFF